MEQTRISGNLTLNLSLPLLSTSLEQPVYTRQDPANQLTDHLASQLATNLTCRGPLNTLLTGHLNSSLATEDRPVIAQALQMVAAKFAGELVDRFPDLLAKQIAITNGTTQRSAPPPQTSKDYSFYLNRFIENNLTKFYKDDYLVKDLAERAADQARVVTKEYRLQPEETAGLAKLALYDFVILCDNSTSMSEDNRMPALEDTLERVATFATILSTDGISIRFLNYNKDGDGDFDHLKTVKSVAQKLEKIQCSGDTKLGTILEKKIVKPMILEKATAGTLKKPIIIVIITDGEPVGEEDERLRDTIRSCKKSMECLGYKNAATVFLISRVGSSEEAKKFLEALRDDKEIGHMVYSSKEDLNEKWEAFRAGGDNAAYTAWLLKLFLAALEKVEY